MAKKKRTPPSWVSAYKDDTSRLWRTEGRSVWNRLGNGLISPIEKSMVAADPDLANETIAKMVAERGGQEALQEIEFFFNNPAPGDKVDRADDIGYPVLSFCIKQDRNATWADIVARYCLVRRTPFLETAIFLRTLHKTKGLFYFDNKSLKPIRWTPRVSKRKTVRIEDEWAQLLELQENA